MKISASECTEIHRSSLHTKLQLTIKNVKLKKKILAYNINSLDVHIFTKQKSKA